MRTDKMPRVITSFYEVTRSRIGVRSPQNRPPNISEPELASPILRQSVSDKSQYSIVRLP
jgi:hypothetical protein